MPMSLKENQPRTTRKRLIIVANTGRLMQRSARPIPFISSEGGTPAEAESAVLMAAGIGGIGLRRSEPGRLKLGCIGIGQPRCLNFHCCTVGQAALARDHHRIA